MIDDDRRRREQVDRIIDEAFNPRVDPLPCPRCGRIPALAQTARLSWYECRGSWLARLLDLRPHALGPAAIEGWSAGMYAVAAAAGAWNRAVTGRISTDR